ncbi:hypothetical protein [Aneurinibacillus danicus]|jgi:hypothetical protein|uniref:Uncharacterized protein n=1 Tax=Aneurinibacillus danicus TaxID=267746 RepID=A0A511VD92_9BACL|nr:hypothetical protein [Aneurinibacillus danicus]GEN36835.1 hypothetical protein ADA01nite_42950 [Aneurinibacillus danicus]
MKWEEVRKGYHDQWVIFTIIEAYSKDGKRYVEEMTVVDTCIDGNSALKESNRRNQESQHQIYGFFHTSLENVVYTERKRVSPRWRTVADVSDKER